VAACMRPSVRSFNLRNYLDAYLHQSWYWRSAEKFVNAAQNIPACLLEQTGNPKNIN